ncbi:acetyl esterase/lipase [Sphingomonas insulae]|uniref:BD-FAE-like domain-containing protein n=1 Tax=Sphingomonas insulae TaxID=424800 RepID=A0ABN1HP81_9SPHN|nr:alpha/beta hydrolase [Sphingomonas insulae]NIJ30729.1 acetyl esterase/lipase [Sphingomonas insulae]
MKTPALLAALVVSIACPAHADHVVDDSYTVARRFEGYRTQYPGIAMPVIAPRTGQTIAYDLIYKSLGSRDLHIDVFAPPLKHRARQGLVLVHGGAWRSGSKAHFYALANLLAQRGFTIFLPEYRLTPEEPYPAGMDDIADALAWAQRQAKRYGLDADSIAIGGASSGGQMASLLAYHRTATAGRPFVPPNALIDLDGVLDATTPLALQYENAAGPQSPLAQWLGGSFEQIPGRWRDASAASHVGPASPPTLIVSSGAPRFTAGRDRVVAVLQRHGIKTTTYSYPRAPHDFWLFEPYLDEAVAQITTFLHTVDVGRRHGKPQ